MDTETINREATKLYLRAGAARARPEEVATRLLAT